MAFRPAYVSVLQRVYAVPQTLFDRRVLAFLGNPERLDELAESLGIGEMVVIRRALRYVVNDRLVLLPLLHVDVRRNHLYVTARDWINAGFPVLPDETPPEYLPPNEEPEPRPR